MTRWLTWFTTVFLAAYPDLFGRPVRFVSPEPSADYPWAARNKDDIGFGVPIFLAKTSYVGATRYETLALALAGEQFGR